MADEDAIVLELEGQAILIDWMLVFRLVDDGVIERSSIPISVWRDYFEDPGVSDVWTKTRHWYSEGFVEFMETNIVNP